MIQIPENVFKELLEALGQSVEVLAKSCGDCDDQGEFSFCRGRLYSIKNVIEEAAKEVAA